MKDLFSKALAQHLLQYYGRIPSASIFARDFNFRAPPEISPISQETARRWIRGISLPEMDKLQLIAEWLGIEIGFLGAIGALSASKRGKESDPNQSTSNVGSGKNLNQVEIALLQVFRETDLRGKRSLLAHADALIPGLIPPSALSR